MLSVVVPLYNEEESLDAFYKELLSFLAKGKYDYEIIFVDDGSSDSTLDKLKKLASKNQRVRVFSHRKNKGKAEALTLAFQKARGDEIVTLDGDLQDKPSEVPKLLKKLIKFDVVCGWRKNRKDSLGKVVFSKVFNSMANIFWGLKLHDYNCGLKAYKKDAAKSLSLYGGMHRFIPLLTYQEGFSVTEVPIVHQKRKFGKSKYGISKVFKDLPDIFTMLFLSKYSTRPLHFFGFLGGALFLVGFAVLFYLTVLRFQGESIGDRPLLLFGILLVLSGFQVFLTGFLADLFINSSTRRLPSLKYSSEELKS